MKVEQTIWRADSRLDDGRVFLIAKSRGIDDNLSAKLAQWTIDCFDLSDRQSDCICFYRPAKNKLVVSRSIFAQWGRGDTDRRVSTTMACVIDADQLEGYNHNAILFTNAMLSTGNLHLPETERTTLPSLEIPNRSLFTAEDCFDEMEPRKVESIARAIEIHKQVAIFGVSSPPAFLGSFLGMLSREQRLRISFTTGARLNSQRPFNLHFFASEDADLKRELVQAQIRTISVQPAMA
jgi:hypothetical protein